MRCACACGCSFVGHSDCMFSRLPPLLLLARYISVTQRRPWRKKKRTAVFCQGIDCRRPVCSTRRRCCPYGIRHPLLRTASQCFWWSGSTPANLLKNGGSGLPCPRPPSSVWASGDLSHSGREESNILTSGRCCACCCLCLFCCCYRFCVVVVVSSCLLCSIFLFWRPILLDG